MGRRALINVGIVDDHPLVGAGLRTALAAQRDLRLEGVATTLDEALAMLDAHALDVVIVDIRLGDRSGLELIRVARDRPRAPAFLVLSSFDMPQYVRAALELGASGFLLKTAPIGDVVSAIRTIAAGEVSFEDRLLSLAAGHPTHRLTDRERDIVGQVLQGRSNGEIATVLGISKKTVETHMAHLFQRFGVTTRTDLALRAEREGWLDVPQPHGAGT